MSEVKKTKTTKETKAKKVEEKKIVKEKVKKEPKIEVKPSQGLLTKDEQKKTRCLSKIIRIIAKIGKICGMIVLPFVVILMVVVPILFSHLEVSGNIVDFKG